MFYDLKSLLLRCFKKHVDFYLRMVNIVGFMCTNIFPLRDLFYVMRKSWPIPIPDVNIAVNNQYVLIYAHLPTLRKQSHFSASVKHPAIP